MSPRSIISVDVEDYFQVEAFARVVDRNSWGSFASRVERNTERILDLFDERQIKGTFFILGWVADRYFLAPASDHMEKFIPFEFCEAAKKVAPIVSAREPWRRAARHRRGKGSPPSTAWRRRCASSH